MVTLSLIFGESEGLRLRLKVEMKAPEKLEKVLVSRENGGAKIERCAKKMQSRLYRKVV